MSPPYDAWADLVACFSHREMFWAFGIWAAVVYFCGKKERAARK